MTKNYSDSVQEQINDLFFSLISEDVEKGTKPPKEEVIAVAQPAKRVPVAKPVVERKEIKKTKDPLKRIVEKKEVTPVDSETFVKDLAEKMTKVNKRTNSAAGQEKLTEEQFTLYNFQVQLDSLKRTIRESTMVSGIGQGGDGQTPGSGEVLLRRLDDVDLSELNAGDTLVWDDTQGKFVAGSGGGGGSPIITSYVEKIVAGDGVDISPSSGEGEVTINLDANLEDLSNISGTPTDGDLLVYQGLSWTAGQLNTEQLTLSNPTNQPYGLYRSLPSGSYENQEDANLVFGTTIGDLQNRVEILESATDPGTYLGKIDAVNSSEPDTDSLNNGDYYIHEGDTGQLWGSGVEVKNDDTIIWDGSTWDVITSAHTLQQLGDVHFSTLESGQFLVYDGVDTWRNQEVDIPTITVSESLPDASVREVGDIHYHSLEELLYIVGVDGEWSTTFNDDQLVTKEYVDDAIDDIDIPSVDLEDYATKTYVDDAIENLGDVLNFKGILDFTSESEPGVYQPGDVYVNTGTGAPDNSWSLSNDVSPGEMYGRGETQWALIGSSGVDLTGYATQTDVDDAADLQVSKSGDTMSGALNFLRGDKPDKQFKISPNGGSDYATNIYSFQGQMRFRTTHSDVEGDYTSHIILIPDENNPQTKIWNVVETNDTGAVPRSYVDEKVDGAKTYTDEQIAALPSASTGVPVGSIMIWMNSGAPDGWFKLQGGSFDVDAYPLLHAYLERTHDYTSGTLPNWSGRYPGEWGNHLNYDLGRKVDYETARPKTPFTTDNPGNHTHRYGNNAYGGGATNSAHDARNQSKYVTDGAGAHTHTITGGGDSTTRPRTIVVHYIIKHD